MAVANTSLNVSELGFFEIKENLKKYLSERPEFTDYDFEGSTINTLLDVLSYNTYYNSYYLNMVANEMFLDTAIMKESAYSISKMLNYLPRSARSSFAKITISFTPSDYPEEIVIPKFSKFTTTVNGVNYNFVTMSDYSVFNENGVYRKTIDIYEGLLLSYKFTHTANGTGIFEIPIEGLDTSSMVVEVQSNSSSTTKKIYDLVEDATEVAAASEVYYIQKNANGFYEIYFGDGILGKAIAVNNVITVTFRACNGTTPNKANKFTVIGYSGYNKLVPTTKYTGSIMAVVQPALEGQDEETLEHIKFNAPRSYEIQNRLITTTDYKQYILNNYADIQSVNVWGGEDHDPPIYGKTLISVKPTTGFLVSNNRKNAILLDIQKYAPMSIDPIMVDPTFLFVKPTIVVNYDSRVTATSVQSLYGRISSVVVNYETNQLGKFSNNFRSSKLSALIDASDKAVVSNELSILMEKRFAPTLNSKFTYKIVFNNPLYHPYEGYVGCLDSTGFTILGSAKTMFLDDDGYGKVRMYYYANATKTYYSTNIGSIDYGTGTIIINAVTFLSYQNDEIRVTVKPDKPDILSVKNQIILLTYPLIQMFDTNTGNVIYSQEVDVIGNTTLVQSSALLNTVTL